MIPCFQFPHDSSSWGLKESDTSEHEYTHISNFFFFFFQVKCNMVVKKTNSGAKLF